MWLPGSTKTICEFWRDFVRQALTLIADQAAAIPPLPSHGVVTGLTAMHGLQGRNERQV